MPWMSECRGVRTCTASWAPQTSPYVEAEKVDVIEQRLEWNHQRLGRERKVVIEERRGKLWGFVAPFPGL